MQLSKQVSNLKTSIYSQSQVKFLYWSEKVKSFLRLLKNIGMDFDKLYRDTFHHVDYKRNLCYSSAQATGGEITATFNLMLCAVDDEQKDKGITLF